MEFRRLFDILAHQQIQAPKKVCLADTNGSSFTTNEIITLSTSVSAGALKAGLKPNDKVAIIAKQGSPEWLALDIGFQHVGVITVPLSTSWSNETLHYILEEASIKLAFAPDRETALRLVELKKKLPLLKDIFSLKKSQDTKHINDFVTQPDGEYRTALETFKAGIHEDDTATIIYTDGSDGPIKGVVLSHKNLVSNIKALLATLPLNSSHKAVAIQPPHRIFERVMIYTYLAAGLSIHFASDNSKVLDQIKKTRPHYFTADADIIESFLEDILNAGIEGNSIKRKLWLDAIDTGQKIKDFDKISLSQHIRLGITDSLVFRRWRNAFGGKIEGIIVGPQPLPKSYSKLLSAAGIDIRRGYGMIETGAFISLNRFDPKSVKHGSAGQPMKHIEIKISNPPDEFGNGEILVRSDSVMSGYLHQKNLTKSIIDHEGWLKTGEIGRLDEKGHLHINGKKNDIIQLADKNKVHPSFLETKLKNASLIKQCIVIGKGQEYPVTLIVPSDIHTRLWYMLKGETPLPINEAIQDAAFRDVFRDIIQEFNNEVRPFERIGGFRLLDTPWTVENKMLTPSFRKRRQVIATTHFSLIAEMYGLDADLLSNRQ